LDGLSALMLRVMSRPQLRDHAAVCDSSALTVAVFFLALWLLPFQTFTPFLFPRIPGFL
jgi:hypothetical protein